MAKNYRVNNYGGVGQSQWSIDHYEDDTYLAQEAFFFKHREEAELRAKELADKDGCEYRGVKYRFNAGAGVAKEQARFWKQGA